MKYTFGALSLVLGLVVLAGSCGKDDELCPDPTQPECPDYDPCYLVSSADAAFIIYDSIYAGWADTALAMPQDTGLLPLVGYKFFRSLHIREGTRYEWRVGLDTRTFTEPVFRLDFSWQQPSVIDVRLLATVDVRFGVGQNLND
jgi:hypothetical protein